MRIISHHLGLTAILCCSIIFLFSSSCVSSKKFADMEVLKEYYKLKGDTLTMIKAEKLKLQKDLMATESDLDMTTQRLAATQEALDISEEKYLMLNREYAQLQANNERQSASSKAESNALKGQIQQFRSENQSMKQILTNLDAAHQIHLNGAVLADDNWNDKLSRMQEISEVLEAERSQLNGLYQILSENVLFQEEGFEVLKTTDGVSIRLKADIVFREGKTQLNSKGRSTIDELTGIIMRNSNLDVVVEGHTDDKGSDNSNWNVSALRASAVVKQMIKNEMRPSRLMAIGRSSHKKILFDDTEEARSANRRVEIIIKPRTYR